MNAMTGMRGVAAATTKFKVGDRVRVVDTSTLRYGTPLGTRGTITGVNKSSLTFDLEHPVDGTIMQWLNEPYIQIELLPTFAVGDRVRIKSGPDNGGYGAIGDIGVVDNFDRDSLYVKFETGSRAGESWWIKLDDIEPAPLRIEAGKHYRTRDGRVVGPTYGPKYSHYWGKSALWIDGESYDDNGRAFDCQESHDDLIAEAEAPTPAKGNPAAQVDNLADEYGGGAKRGPKFKVGDRIVANTTSGGRAFIKGNFYTVKQVDGDAIRADNERGEFDGWAAKFFDLAPATKFKVGDRVRNAIPGNDYTADGIITSVSDAGIRVKWDDAGWMDGDLIWGESELRLVAPATSGNPTLIVALIENGQPKPTTRPYIHRSREAATAEAKRLAGKHKGKEFGVYEFVSSASAAPAKTYDHEWQRLAAEGKKLGAIQALRAQAGLTLYGAKTAVESFTAAA